MPLRAIFEALGAEGEWNPAAQTIRAMRRGVGVGMNIGQGAMTRNGVLIPLDVAPQIIGGRTFVPVRAIAECFGADVTWDAATMTITISE